MPPPPTEPMAIEQGTLLADFARTCKAAARAVSLYPGAHPAIGSSLSRLVASAGRLARQGAVKLAVHRELLVIDGRAPLRPDPSIGELATLLHERLIGRLTVRPEADAEDWRALLLLLARSPDDLMAGGGIRQAWTLTGRNNFEIQEIDYAEVLRERGSGEDVTWDRIIAYCLEGKKGMLDVGALTSLLEALADPARFSRLVEQLQETVGPDSTKVGVRVAALLQLMRTAIDAARTQGDAEVNRAFETIATSCARLTPEMMIGMLDRRQATDQDEADLVSTVADRMTDQAIASFMARAVAADRKGTERLAQALEALAPGAGRKKGIVDQARDEARQGELGAEPGFETMWESVANAVMSYTLVSNLTNVSDEYGKELSSARRNAMEVERISDDPPERVQAWVTTVSESSLAQLDLEMLLDLLRIEGATAQWEPLSMIAASEAERRTLTGDIAGALALLESLVRETKADGRPPLRTAAARAVDRLGAGPIARH
ncbi:MAG TPA: hypothetical protein VMS40_25920, partial [Vicinamibacterales bacterium]|nr:hypothetical protein [Vicinamibacterales bacterium]